MAIPLGSSKTGYPSVKFRAQGQYVDLVVVNVGVVPWKDYVTGAVKKSDDGKDRTQDVITGKVIRGTSVITISDVDTPVPEGELVSVFAAGHHRWDWIGAQKSLDGGLMVGDVLRVTYTAEEAGRGASPKKVWTFQLRHPRPEEAAQTADAEATNRKLTGIALAGGSDVTPAQAQLQAEPF